MWLFKTSSFVACCVALLSNSVDLRAQVVTEHLEPRYRRQLGGSVLVFRNTARGLLLPKLIETPGLHNDPTL